MKQEKDGTSREEGARLKNANSCRGQEKPSHSALILSSQLISLKRLHVATMLGVTLRMQIFLVQ